MSPWAGVLTLPEARLPDFYTGMINKAHFASQGFSKNWAWLYKGHGEVPGRTGAQ